MTAVGRVVVCTFRVDEMLLGVEVSEVQDVVACERITPVRLGRPEVVGLSKLRGDIVPVVEPRTALNLSVHPRPRDPMGLVLRRPTGPVILLVDTVGDVVHLESASVVDVPANVEAALRTYFRGVFRLDGDLHLLLDPARMLAPPLEDEA